MFRFFLRLFIASNLIVATAHAFGLGLPNVGTILNQVQPQETPTFSSRGPKLMIEKSDGSSVRLQSNETFLLRSITISNNTLFENKTLLALIDDANGQKISLFHLMKLASRITDFYRSHGYPLARTIVPAQSIEDGVVRFQVIEPRYGSITLNNTSGIHDSLLQATISTIKTGHFVEESSLDHALLLLSDIASVVVVPALKPGLENGTSDLLISTSSGPAVVGRFGLDNHGNKYTGGINVGGALTINNPLQHGDTLDFNALSSGLGMNYQSLAYESLINGRGTHFGGSFSSLTYAFKVSPVGDKFLDATGSAKLTSFWVKQTLLRSRDSSFYGQFTFERVGLLDHLNGGTSQDYKDRHLEMISAAFSGDFRNVNFVGGNTSWSLRPTMGKLNFDDKKSESADLSDAKTSGYFSKLVSSLTNVSELGRKLELLINFKGQWASGNLDSSQKMSAGGSHSVRAYASGAVSGDQGYFVSAGVKQLIGIPWAGKWSATAFIDHASIMINKNAWSRDENRATLTGAGVGLFWAGPYRISGSAYLAAPIGLKPSMVGDSQAVQFSLEIQKIF
jgi:hemolysin activation/secretion protein